MNRIHTVLSVAMLVGVVAVAGCRKAEKPESSAKSSSPGKVAAAAKEAGAEAPQSGPAEVGSVMPQYTVNYLTGTHVPLTSERGKVVFLNLWATWCPPCRAEIPELQKLHNQYEANGFEVLGVSLDEAGISVVKQFAVDNQMTYPLAIDPEGKIGNILQTSVLPTSVLIDRSGKIIWKKFGAVEPGDPTLQTAIEQALGLPVTASSPAAPATATSGTAPAGSAATATY